LIGHINTVKTSYLKSSNGPVTGKLVDPISTLVTIFWQRISITHFISSLSWFYLNVRLTLIASLQNLTTRNHSLQVSLGSQWNLLSLQFSIRPFLLNDASFNIVLPCFTEYIDMLIVDVPKNIAKFSRSTTSTISSCPSGSLEHSTMFYKIQLAGLPIFR
jgi:hypothetical protein